jgi:alginate O-acetyltransferase complex protein AlgI
MLFNSFPFLLGFLPAAIFVYALADPFPRARMPVLIALSLVFYGYWDPRFLALIILSILGNWLAALLYEKTRRGAVITLAILGNLLVLGTFKYSVFFAQNVTAVTGFEPYSWQFALPLGISFFTFHHVMYLVDLKRGRAPIYPLDRYALYICFFPQSIAGPLARWNEVMQQFGQRAFGPGWERRVAEGAMYIVIGLAEKVLLGDPLAEATNPIYARAAAGPVGNGDAWLALGFAFQVFFDFAGYSDIAIGLGLIFGVQLPRNFDAPFRTTSLLEFWQRWHMTLARFLRDYVFNPLSRSGIGGRGLRSVRVLAALLLTMSLCGLWHGAGWTYVIWGTVQGVGLIFAAVWRRYLTPPPALVGWAATVAYFMLTVVIFRAPSLTVAWHIFEGLATLPDVQIAGRKAFALAAFCAIALPPSHEIISRITKWPHPAIAYGLAAVATYCLLEIGQGEPLNFIYFQF